MTETKTARTWAVFWKALPLRAATFFLALLPVSILGFIAIQFLPCQGECWEIAIYIVICFAIATFSALGYVISFLFAYFYSRDLITKKFYTFLIIELFILLLFLPLFGSLFFAPY